MFSLNYKPHRIKKIKSSLFTPYYVEACNKFAGPISAALRLGNTEVTSQRWRAAGNTASDLIGQSNPRPTAPIAMTLPLRQPAGHLTGLYGTVTKLIKQFQGDLAITSIRLQRQFFSDPLEVPL